MRRTKNYFRVMYADEFNTPTIELDEIRTHKEAIEVLNNFEFLNDNHCWVEEYEFIPTKKTFYQYPNSIDGWEDIYNY